jgi:hypothetical protein
VHAFQSLACPDFRLPVLDLPKSDFPMTKIRFALVTAALASLICLIQTGCGGGSSDVASSTSTSQSDHDHDHEGDHDHDHDHEGDHEDHEGEHDHPAHGPNGGHMVKLDDGSEVEVALLKEDDKFTVYPNEPATVTKVEMITTIDDEQTTYPFEKAEGADSEGTFTLTSPELATAARMGEAVDVKLVVTSEGGESGGKFVLHEH